MLTLKMTQYLVDTEKITEKEVNDFYKSLNTKEKTKFINNVKKAISYLVNERMNYKGNELPYDEIPVDEQGWRRQSQDDMVVVPKAKAITMEGIQTNGVAYDYDTGDFLGYLEPEQYYELDRPRNVLEVPIKKLGGMAKEKIPNAMKELLDKNKATNILIVLVGKGKPEIGVKNPKTMAQVDKKEKRNKISKYWLKK